MTNRDRYINTLLYKPTDRIPLEPGGPRQSTLRRWRAEGLPEGADYFRHIMDLLHIDMEYPEVVAHGVNTRMIPIFEEKVRKHENGHYIVQDWMGAITEISDEFDYTYIRNAIDFVTRKWHKFPVETIEDWQEMKKRYDAFDPSRLPKNAANLHGAMKGRGYISHFNVNGPFWQLREWMGFENLCMAFIEQPDFVREMIEFWCGFVLELFENAALLIPFDCLYISEDMAYKAHSMISPAMTREFLLPVYKKWAAAARRYGVQLIDMDSDGYIEELIPIWIEAGINVCNPIEVAAHNDITLFSAKFGKKIAYRGGVDKRAIAAGGSAMENEVRRVFDPFIRGGGLIPGCDHGVPHDISFENFISYTKLLAELTGWL
jgi:uroporphyrinogen decarboxylase